MQAQRPLHVLSSDISVISKRRDKVISSYIKPVMLQTLLISAGNLEAPFCNPLPFPCTRVPSLPSPSPTSISTPYALPPASQEGTGRCVGVEGGW